MTYNSFEDPNSQPDPSAPQQPSAPQHGTPFGRLSFGTIIGHAFTYPWHNPALLIGAAVGIPFLAIFLSYEAMMASFAGLTNSVGMGTGSVAAAVFGVVIVTLLFMVVSVVAQVFAQVIVIGSVRETVLGRVAGFSELWQRARPSLPRLIGYPLLLSFAIIVALTLLGAISAGLLALSYGLMSNTGYWISIPLTLILWIAFFPLLVWLSIKLLLVPSILLIEGTTIGEAVRRSWQLIKGRSWSAFGITMIISLGLSTIGSILSSIILMLGAFATPAALSQSAMAVPGIDFSFLTVLADLPTMLLATAAMAFQCVAVALFYIDARSRQEHFGHYLGWYQGQLQQGFPASALADPFEVRSN